MPDYFGQRSSDTTPQPSTLFGQDGCFTVPRGWPSRVTSEGIWQCSPNADFSNPVYQITIDADGTGKIQDMMSNRALGRG